MEVLVCLQSLSPLLLDQYSERSQRLATISGGLTTLALLPPASCLLLQVLRMLVKLYHQANVPDYVNICHCLMFLNDAHEVSAILYRLIQGSTVRILSLSLSSLLSHSHAASASQDVEE